MSIFIINYTIKKITRSEHSPLARIILFFISAIAQACSPFSGPVDKAVSDSYYYSKSGDDICYSPMGNWFELGNRKLNADTESFQVIAREFGKDKNHLYFQNNIIDEEVDKGSFLVNEEERICFDKNHVYVPYEYLPVDFRQEHEKGGELWIVDKANPKSFEKIDFDWAKDDVHYFYVYRPVDVDYHSFEVLNLNFAKDKHQVYLLKSFHLLPSISIDAATVRSLNSRYVADKDNVYDFQEYRESKIVDSLISISHDGLKNFEILEDDYLSFDQTVVRDGVVIDGADVSSFQVITNPYSKDKDRVYYCNKVIKEADPNTFEVFEAIWYAKDKDHVFVNGEILKEANVDTFGPVKEEYSLLYQDKNHTYRGSEIVEE